MTVLRQLQQYLLHAPSQVLPNFAKLNYTLHIYISVINVCFQFQGKPQILLRLRIHLPVLVAPGNP